MIDFEITNSGDLIIDNQEKISSFNIKFVLSKFDTMRVRFKNNTKNKNEQESLINNNKLKIDFYTSKDSDENKISTIFNENELRQRIMIRLRTEKNDIKNNKNFGSQISLMKHSDITDIYTKEKVRDIVFNEISDILEEPTVIVEHKKIEGPFFCQNLNVYILEKKKELYSFTIEG